MAIVLREPGDIVPAGATLGDPQPPSQAVDGPALTFRATGVAKLPARDRQNPRAAGPHSLPLAADRL